jgi:hypothetical protein
MLRKERHFSFEQARYQRVTSGSFGRKMPTYAVFDGWVISIIAGWFEVIADKRRQRVYGYSVDLQFERHDYLGLIGIHLILERACSVKCRIRLQSEEIGETSIRFCYGLWTHPKGIAQEPYPAGPEIRSPFFLPSATGGIEFSTQLLLNCKCLTNLTNPTYSSAWLFWWTAGNKFRSGNDEAVKRSSGWWVNSKRVDCGWLNSAGIW